MALEKRCGGNRRVEDLEAIEAAAKAGAKQQAKRSARGYFLLLLVLFAGAIVWQRSNDARIVAAAKATCKRVDTLRVEESNRNAQVMWAALYRARERESQLAGSGVKETLHKTSAAYIKQSYELMRWTPSTDCEEASQHPKTYVAPSPRPFDATFLSFRKVPR